MTTALIIASGYLAVVVAACIWQHFISKRNHEAEEFDQRHFSKGTNQ